MLTRAFAEAERTADGCLLATSWRSSDGYIKVSINGQMFTLHRLIMERHLGRSLMPDETVDHTCHNQDLTCNDGTACRHRRCIEVAHMDIVDQPTNWARGRLGGTAANRAKTHCPQGHPYSGENLYLTPDGERTCRTCVRAAGRRHDLKRRAKA